jgi:hypothetical protein
MKKIMIIFLGVLMVCTSCKKAFLDINQNPNEATVVTPNVVLSAALNGSARSIGEGFVKLNDWMGYWSRSGNYVADAETESYNITNGYDLGSNDLDWGNAYAVLNRYDYIETQGHALDLPFYVGVAKTMKAVHFSSLVDCFGDIPYSQAFQIAANPRPKYDSAASIYSDLINQLDSAVTYFNSAKLIYDASTTPTSVLSTDNQYDIMYGRDTSTSADIRVNEWIAFANTVKLKLLLHEYAVASPSYITTEINKIDSTNIGFIGPGQSATVNPTYAASSNQISPFYSFFFTVTGAQTNNYAFYRANTYAVNFYNNSGDERQYLFYAPLTNGSIGSNYEGDPNSLANTFTSGIGSGTLKSATQSQPILMDFESLFLQAEAVQRGWNIGATSTAQQLYQQAVEQNFVYIDPDGNAASDISDADAYVQGVGIPGLNVLPDPSLVQYIVWTDPTSIDKIKLILTQKWAALNSINWVEAWTDYRRTGFPTSDVLGISHASSHVEPQIPIRYLYPETELNSNFTNVPVLGANAQFTSKIFWQP